MRKHALVTWMEIEHPHTVEREILASGIRLPINIDGNPCREDVVALSEVRLTGVPFDTVIDYTPLPPLWGYGGLSLVALYRPERHYIRGPRPKVVREASRPHRKRPALRARALGDKPPRPHARISE